MSDTIRYEETQYGFNWGAAEVTRDVSDAEKGWVKLAIRTSKNSIQVYVSQTGKIRVYSSIRELV